MWVAGWVQYSGVLDDIFLVVSVLMTSAAAETSNASSSDFSIREDVGNLSIGHS